MSRKEALDLLDSLPDFKDGVMALPTESRYKLLIWPNDHLLTKAELVTDFKSEALKELVVSMFEIMHKSGGIGLAATQVGSNKQVFIADLSSIIDPFVFGFSKPKTFINPVILKAETPSPLEEGCLSFPGITQIVRRPYDVTIKAFDVDGNEFIEEANGLYAHVLQHELEHLQGKTIYNHMSNLRKDIVKRKLNKVKKYTE